MKKLVQVKTLRKLGKRNWTDVSNIIYQIDENLMREYIKTSKKSNHRGSVFTVYHDDQTKQEFVFINDDVVAVNPKQLDNVNNSVQNGNMSKSKMLLNMFLKTTVNKSVRTLKFL